MLGRGWATLDRVRYRVSLYGTDGAVQGDGRVMVRCSLDVVGAISHREALGLVA